MAEETTSSPTTSTNETLAVKRSVLRVVLFSIISLGIYGFYWFYVTRKQVTAEVNGKDQVGLQTAGLIVPILNIFILYWLYRDIDILHKKVGLTGIPALPLALAPVVVSVIIQLTPKLSILGLSNLLVFAFVVSKVNEYWDKKTDGRATNAPVTPGEIAVTVAGLIFMILVMVAIGAAIMALIGATNGGELKDLKDTAPGYDY